jgi:hypothetical protein
MSLAGNGEKAATSGEGESGLSKNINDAIHRPHDESRLKEQKKDEDTQKTHDNPECPVRRCPHEILCSLAPLMRSGEGFNQVRTKDHDVVVRYVVGPEPITVRLRRV